MAKKNEKTSKTIASKAAKVLKDPKATKDAKSIAASALTQAPEKPKKEVKYAPVVGQLFTKEGTGKIFEVLSFSPVEVVEHSIIGGCHATTPVILDLDDDFRAVSREEEVAALY